MVDRSWDNYIDVFFSMLNFFFGNVLLKSWDYLLLCDWTMPRARRQAFFIAASEFSAVEPFALRLPENADLIAHHQAADQL
jgi:hypothetical protein